MEKKYCIYRHITRDTNEVFYIGIGNICRPLSKRGRNNLWNKIVNKHNYEVQILKSDLSQEDACELEKILISHYGRRNNKTGILCNMTDGGEGVVGCVFTKDMKTKMSISQKIRFQNINVWNKNIAHTEEHKKKLKNNSGQAKKVICTITNKVWNCVNDCAIENNLVSITLSQYLRGNRKNKTTFKFLTDEC